MNKLYWYKEERERELSNNNKIILFGARFAEWCVEFMNFIVDAETTGRMNERDSKKWYHGNLIFFQIANLWIELEFRVPTKSPKIAPYYYIIDCGVE